MVAPFPCIKQDDDLLPKKKNINDSIVYDPNHKGLKKEEEEEEAKLYLFGKRNIIFHPQANILFFLVSELNIHQQAIELLRDLL